MNPIDEYNEAVEAFRTVEADLKSATQELERERAEFEESRQKVVDLRRRRDALFADADAIWKANWLVETRRRELSEAEKQIIADRPTRAELEI